MEVVGSDFLLIHPLGSATEGRRCSGAGGGPVDPLWLSEKVDGVFSLSNVTVRLLPTACPAPFCATTAVEAEEEPVADLGPDAGPDLPPGLDPGSGPDPGLDRGLGPEGGLVAVAVGFFAAAEGGLGAEAGLGDAPETEPGSGDAVSLLFAGGRP